LFKIRKTLPYAHCRKLESYLKDRLFKLIDESTNFRKLEAGILQGSV
jgi:hypothetical protein